MTTPSTKPADLGVAQLGLGLTLVLGILQLDADDGHQSLADILAAEVLLFFLEEALGPRVVVDGAGEGRPEAGQVSAAFVGVDVVREREDVVVVTGVPLHRNFDRVMLGLPALRVEDLSRRPQSGSPGDGWLPCAC